MPKKKSGGKAANDSESKQLDIVRGGEVSHAGFEDEMSHLFAIHFRLFRLFAIGELIVFMGSLDFGDGRQSMIECS